MEGCLGAAAGGLSGVGRGLGFGFGGGVVLHGYACGLSLSVQGGILFRDRPIDSPFKSTAISYLLIWRPFFLNCSHDSRPLLNCLQKGLV